MAGNRNDLFAIEVQFEVVTDTVKDARIPVSGLFLNADAGFDSKGFRAKLEAMDINANICFNKWGGHTDRHEYFDQELYDERHAVERTNAWTDSYRFILNRFDTTTESWKGFNYLAFMAIAIKNSKRTKKKFKSLR